MEEVFYQRGIVLSAIMVEAATEAQKHFNTKALDAEQFRWGMENVKFTPERIKEIGLDGMVVPFSTARVPTTPATVAAGSSNGMARSSTKPATRSMKPTARRSMRWLR
jgi:hypothetical protein